MLPRIKSVEKGIKMKREDLEKLGLTKEQIDQIMDANGKDINEAKKREEERIKSLEQAQTKLDTLTKEFDEFKKSKMTEEEKKKQLELEEKTKYETALAEAEKIKTNYTRLTRESKVKEVLGVYANDEEVKKIIPSFIADDEETSISNATIFKQFIEKQKEEAKTKALEDAARTIPQPQGQIPPKVEPFKVPDIF
jgi:hypothetical protein